LDIDRLTQIIEAEVRKALSELANPPQQVERKKVLVVFTFGCACQNTALKQVEQLIAADYDVTVVLSPIALELMTENVKKIKGISAVLTEGVAVDISNMVEAAEVIVVPLLSRTAAAKLALGIADELVLMVVMQGLITGKPVIAAKNAADPQDVNCPFLATENTPPALIQLAKNYLKTLASFGMKLVDVAQLADVVMNKPQTTVHKVTVERSEYSPISDKSGKPVITQAVIAALAEDVKALTISNPAIVTPLAYDLAKARGIEIVAKR